MRARCLLSIVPAILAVSATAQTEDKKDCSVFVLKKTAEGLMIEAVPIAESETKVFVIKPGGENIDVILPVGPGGSGSVAQTAPGGMIIVRRSGDTLRATFRQADGTEYKRPPRKLADLRRHDIRVCVTAADGAQAAFLIEQNRDVRRDLIGPIVDMFAGKIPLNSGDYVVCTDTYRRATGSKVYGKAPFEHDRHLFVKVRLPGGREGDFILDTGGAQSAVVKQFLPPGIEIKKSAMIQYSKGVKRLLDYTPGGATGPILTVLGHAALPELNVGGLRFEDVSVTVMSELPDLFGRPVSGIIGIDLLQRCEVLTLSFAKHELRMSKEPAQRGGRSLELPFSTFSSHLVVKGLIRKQPVHLVLDTGSPNAFLDSQAAKAVGVEIDADKSRAVRGLDEGSSQASPATIPALHLAGRAFRDVDAMVGALPFFAAQRVHGQNVGLLGNAFFKRFDRLEVDFIRHVIRLVE